MPAAQQVVNEPEARKPLTRKEIFGSEYNCGIYLNEGGVFIHTGRAALFILSGAHVNCGLADHMACLVTCPARQQTILVTNSAKRCTIIH